MGCVANAEGGVRETEFSVLLDFGEGGTTDWNQEYRKRNKSVRVDNEFSFAHAVFEMSPGKPGRNAQKAVGTRARNEE